MYEERDIVPRLEAKLERSFRRPPKDYSDLRQVLEIDARKFPKTRGINAVITSPPYMNELDYVRDNRLRIWFINRSLPKNMEIARRNKGKAYADLLRAVCTRLAINIINGGYIILVVGDGSRRNGRNGQTTKLTVELFATERGLNSFKLVNLYEDTIPDIRRSRRECRGTKKETILVYRKFS